MDEVNALVLEGAADATVLAALNRRAGGAEGGGGVERSSSPATTSRNYVSCVRIKGRPILPPVMTEEVR